MRCNERPAGKVITCHSFRQRTVLPGGRLEPLVSPLTTLTHAARQSSRCRDQVAAWGRAEESYFSTPTNFT
ncbi:hypothetical protein E2C01_014066 [Portunus trituberculatus]|uniref:Uncharacterized protein n=1 Tax=Portunus trituberculatus TaxID=210409 RepID=A0A5B7DJ10_PORTR|nr:hypothetical protein [Portunus trituberculatus]